MEDTEQLSQSVSETIFMGVDGFFLLILRTEVDLARLKCTQQRGLLAHDCGCIVCM